jgi:hypothetical protein
MDIFRANFRRWAAGIFLGAAALMLVLGLTSFSERLTGIDFLIYWLVCFLFTGLAALFALTEMTVISRKSRDAQRDLIKDTLEQTDNGADEIRKSNPEK